MIESGDWVDEAVRQLWLERPGTGARFMQQEILLKCQQHYTSMADDTNSNEKHTSSLSSVQVSLQTPPHPSMITRARIKYSLAFVAYRHVPNPSIGLTEAQQAFIGTKISERMAFRATREFKRADQIQVALEAMGVQLDDRTKTWTMIKEFPSQDRLMPMSNNSPANDVTGSVTNHNNSCKFCQKIFPSRNHVFRHLRDPTTGCGTAIFATGQSIPEPPSAVETKLRQEEFQARRRGHGQSINRTARHANAENTLWIGDLPMEWTNPRKRFSLLRSIFYNYLPRDIPSPWIKRVIRKGYRKEAGGVMLGYAIVVFRDAAEAQRVLELLNQQEVACNQLIEHHGKAAVPLDSFLLKVRYADKSDSMGAHFSTLPPVAGDIHEEDKPVVGGLDPPLIDQFRPLELNEIRRRIQSLEYKLEIPNEVPIGTKALDVVPKHDNLDGDTNDAEVPTDELLLRLVKLYSMLPMPRKYVRRQGRLIPLEIREKILNILESLRWPARNERSGLAAERYLVLHTNVSSDRFYGDLRNACRELMDWADHLYFFSGIAVTKNFVASPHIDHRDQSFQYAVSLGNFGPGGELCVEGFDTTLDTEIVNVVTTQNRIARVDGRHVHYVRTWQAGDRYSLIFYDTSDRHPTPILDLGVDETYLASA